MKHNVGMEVFTAHNNTSPLPFSPLISSNFSERYRSYCLTALSFPFQTTLSVFPAYSSNSSVGIYQTYLTRRGPRWHSGKGAVLQIGRSLVRWPYGHRTSDYGPGVDSASNRNEYQEYFLGVKAAGA